MRRPVRPPRHRADPDRDARHRPEPVPPPQLYSRIGFAHQYRTLGDDELAVVLTRRWAKLGLTLDLSDFTNAQAVAAVGRITPGNFRLVHRLFAQVARVMKINNLTVITSDVIETARGTLVIGEDAT